MATTTTTQRYSVKINSIVCGATADTGNANDEVFVIWQADGGIPVRYPADNYQRMNTTADPGSDVVSTWNIPAGDLNLTFEKEVLVTLWDSTVAIDPSSSIYLMSYEYTAPGINPGYPASETSYTMSNHNGGKYTINASAVTAVSTTDSLQADVRPHFDIIKTKLNQTAPRAAQSGGPNAVPENEAQFVRVLTETLKAWKASPEGAASLEKMRSLDLKGIHAELDSIVKGPQISGALQLAAGDGQIDFSLFSSFSISLAITGEVFVGLYGAIGYACDMSVVKGEGGNTGIYLCGAFVEEVGAGLDGLVEAGVWKLSLKDLGGSYSALAIDIGDIEGEEVGYFQFKSDDTTQGYVVGVGIGEDYEVGDMDPAYIVILPVTSDYPVMQANAGNCLILTKLQCLNQRATAGTHDEVTLYITADAPYGNSSITYRYPTWDDFAMSDDSGDYNIWYPGRSVMFNDSVTVKANDGGDELASFTFNLSDFSGVGSTVSPTSTLPFGVFQNISYQLTALLITLAEAQGDRMNPEEMLLPGQSIWSASGQYQFILQNTDGNLVLYDTHNNNNPLWSSGPNGKSVTMCIMQSDGNLVVYQSGGKADWNSETNGNPGSYLVVDDDGHVYIYPPNGTTPLWQQPQS